jgi:hypothetical protein
MLQQVVFVFSSTVKKQKLEYENYNFACGYIWMGNLVSDNKGGTCTEDVREQGAEENIWTEGELNYGG